MIVPACGVEDPSMVKTTCSQSDSYVAGIGRVLKRKTIPTVRHIIRAATSSVAIDIGSNSGELAGPLTASDMLIVPHSRFGKWISPGGSARTGLTIAGGGGEELRLPCRRHHPGEEPALKSVLRSRGVAYGAGGSVYLKREREKWLARLPAASRAMATLLYEELDALMALRAKAEKALLAEAREHREWHVLKTCPGLGPIRTAELLPVVLTPYRFQSRSKFWAYCGLGVVMRSSSDWVRAPSGRWIREPVQQTRGLNRNFNHTLKRVFKGAATTVIGRGGDEPLYRHYERLLEGGTKPNLAKLTIARQLASIVLAVWRTGEAYEPRRLEATK